MVRPCFLVVDREHAGSISTRKLVLETAKFNVLTAYSGEEAIQTLSRFAAVDGVVTDIRLPDMPCESLILALKGIRPGLPVVVVSTPRSQAVCQEADHYLESFDPARLLELLQRMRPAQTADIEAREEELEAID